MTKVTHITTVHRSADVRIFHKQAATLAARGYQVTLIAVATADRVDRGVQIRALPAPRGRIARMTWTAWRAYRLALAERADVYHFHDPELIPVGLLLRLKGKRVVYDVHEDVVKDIHDKPYLPRWAKPIVRVVVGAIERAAAGRFSAVVAATSAIQATHAGAGAVLVRNVPILDELVAPSVRAFRERSRRVVYVGGLAPFNGPEQMVRAMGALPADIDIRLVLGGVFNSPAEEAVIRALPGSDRVDFLGWVDRSRVAAILADARAGLVVYQPTPNIMESEPNKFFEVLSAGLPLIASNLPHWTRFVEANGCGVTVDPSDPLAIAKAIQALVDDPDGAEAMGRRGREAIERGYNWEAESQGLVALYERLLGSKQPALAPAAAC